MSTSSADYREVIDHLPEGATLVLQEISWEVYEQLLDDLADKPGVRVTYDQGRVEIMSPLRKHEKYKEFIGDLVKAVADKLDVTIESSGSATWKKEKDQKGTESDLSFHIANAERVIGKDELDLTVDPPPDLAVEIDVTNESLNKFPIYAALGVREIWRYVEKRRSVAIYELREGAYVEIHASRSFPMLTPEVLAQFIESSRTGGQKKALTAFRQWLRTAPNAC
jgi:Uma2 family endonuclease